jgi:mono/diheme cytochrome c family protein
MRTAPLTLLGLVLASSCAGVQLRREALSEPGALLFNGYTRDAVDCWRCHGGDGAGAARGPGLASRVPKKSDERLALIIREGKGTMPGFQRVLSDDEVTQLVAWLRAAFPRQP